MKRTLKIEVEKESGIIVYRKNFYKEVTVEELMYKPELDEKVNLEFTKVELTQLAKVFNDYFAHNEEKHFRDIAIQVKITDALQGA